MNDYDVIIIGGGLGGLTAGAKLSKEGKKVLLLEQHYIPGGCATVFRRKDYTMEVGLHELNGLDETDPKRKIFEDLGVFDHVEFIRLPEFYRFVNERVDIVVPHDVRQAMDIFIKNYPRDEKGIRTFFRTIEAIRKDAYKFRQIGRWKLRLLFPVLPLVFPNLVFNLYNTTGDFLDAIIKNEDLKLILAANFGYYHDDPYSLSLIFYSAAQASYYKGGYYIKGGSQNLSNCLAGVIRDNGGEVLLKRLVTKILTKNKKVTGVEHIRSSGKDRDTRTSHAKTVIANAAIPNVAAMLPEKERFILSRKISKLEIAPSLISIYIGFTKALKDLGNKHYSTFISDNSIKNLKDATKNVRDDFSKRGFVFVDYSQIDSGLAPEGKSYGAVCTLDYLSDWNKLDEEQYKRKKERVAETYFAKLEMLIPGITDEIDCFEVGTPKTIRRFTLNPQGTAYGFAQIPKQAGIFRVSCRSPIKNLYFASAWTSPGGGFSGAIIGGWLCAKEILNN